MENPKTILLIDEADDERRLLAIRLEGLGFNVLEAENLLQIQSVLNHEKVDLIVAEWKTPSLGGELPLSLLEPAQRPVILFTDQEIANLPYFLSRTKVKAVVSKKKRSELLLMLSPRKDYSSEFMASKRAVLFGRRILLVEDSPTVRHFIKRAIEARHPDWVVLEAGNAPQALAEIAHHAVDLMVLDLEIQGMDGQVLLKFLLEKPQLRHKPVIALSPFNLRELKETFKSEPYVMFLPKPVVAGQVVDAIQSIIGEKRALAGV
jgi:two-component system cell cycle response regulator DivK